MTRHTRTRTLRRLIDVGTLLALIGMSYGNFTHRTGVTAIALAALIVCAIAQFLDNRFNLNPPPGPQATRDDHQ